MSRLDLEGFYHNNAIDVPRYVAAGDLYEFSASLTLPDGYLASPAQGGLHPLVPERLFELDDTWRVIEYGGYRFEVATANEAARDNGSRIHISTHSSSISGNPGNAHEVALEAAFDPDRHLIYVASPGNGGSSELTSKEAAALRRTGRLMYEDEQNRTGVFPVVAALAGALTAKLEVSVEKLSADSAGCSLVSALGVTLPEGQIREMFSNGRPNLYDFSVAESLWGMVREGLLHARSNGRESPDPYKMTKELMAEVKRHMPKVYSQDNIATGSRAAIRQAGQLPTKLGALRRGPERGDPLAKDMLAYARAQPRSAVTYVMAERDPLYPDPDRLERWAKAMPDLTETTMWPQLYYLQGMTHLFHSFYPGLLLSIKHAASRK